MSTLPKAVMLTADVQIDRRILFEADSLIDAGWHVSVLAPRAVEPDQSDPDYVRRVGGTPSEPSSRHVALRDVYLSLLKVPVLGDVALPNVLLLYRLLLGRHVDKPYWSLFEPTFEDLDADVVVAHDLPMLQIGVAAARKIGARLVYDSHELYPEQYFPYLERQLLGRLERAHIGKADQVITVNDSIAAELQQRYGIGPVATVLNAYRFDPAESVARTDVFRETLPIPNDGTIFLFQGSLSEGRNLFELVEAFGIIKSPNAHLVFLGDGPEKADLIHRRDKLGLGHSVHFHDRVPQWRLLEMSAAADIGVIPYVANCRNNALATPNKLFEYIAAGVPVLASDLIEVKRIVRGYGIGEVGDFTTPAAIAAEVDRTMSQDTWINDHRRGLARARDEINWDREGAKFVRLMVNVLL